MKEEDIKSETKIRNQRNLWTEEEHNLWVKLVKQGMNIE